MLRRWFLRPRSNRPRPGLPAGEGWFVLNARKARWWNLGGRGRAPGIQGKADFPQLGIGLTVLGPGEPMAMYHWETDQEDFLVLSGEALLIIEGVRRDRRFAHCEGPRRRLRYRVRRSPPARASRRAGRVADLRRRGVVAAGDHSRESSASATASSAVSLRPCSHASAKAASSSWARMTASV